MDFEFSEDQVMFRDQFRKVVEAEIAPLVEEAERTETFPKHLFKTLGAQGYVCITYPEAYGGAEADNVTLCIYAEELGACCSGIAGSLMVQSSIGTQPILMLGNEEQKQRWLTPAIKGELISAFGLSESDAGSDAAAIKTTAKQAGDDWIINGSKMWITNGDICDAVLVAARTSPEGGTDGIGIFVIEKDMDGFKVGRKIEKLGNHSSSCAELYFEDVRVPADHLLGEPQGGFKSLMTALNSGRMVIAARSLGIARAAFEASLEYARERIAFGKPIANFQAIQFKLAQMATRIEAARLLTYKAATLKDQGKENAQAASFAKLYATETTCWVTDQAVQIHGGAGYSREHPIERYYRDARLMTIVEGTSEIQQLVIYRRL